MLEEPVLHRELPEYVQTLFKVDYLEGVPTRDVDSAFEHCYCAEGAAELVDLRVLVSVAWGE